MVMLASTYVQTCGYSITCSIALQTPPLRFTVFLPVPRAPSENGSLYMAGIFTVFQAGKSGAQIYSSNHRQ